VEGGGAVTSKLNFNSIIIGSQDPKKLIAFYKKILGEEIEWEEEEWAGWQVGSGHFIIGPHDNVRGKSKEPERILLNFETKSLKEEFARIKALGAKVIAEPYRPVQEQGMTIATFADPDGNYFQLMTPMA